MPTILEQGLPVHIYSGDWDFLLNHWGSEVAVQNMTWWVLAGFPSFGMWEIDKVDRGGKQGFQQKPDKPFIVNGTKAGIWGCEVRLPFCFPFKPPPYVFNSSTPHPPPLPTPLTQNTEFLFAFRLFPHAIHHSSPLLFSPLLPFPPSPYNTQTPLTSQLPPILARSLLPPLLPRRACRPVRCARGGICICA